LPLARERKGGCRGPQGFFLKKIPPNSPYGTHQPNQRFFLKCFFFLAKLASRIIFFKWLKIYVCVFWGFSSCQILPNFARFFKKIARFLYMVLTDSQKCKGCLNFFYFHILSVAKFAQTALWNDPHFRYITKMGEKKKTMIEM